MEGFHIINKLGEGAYSTVLKVTRAEDGNTYALKKVKLLKLNEKEKLNALNEVRILASVKSNFVISYKEAFFDEKESFLGLVMEFADNGDLYQKIVQYKKSGNFFEESDIWRVFIQLVKGLKALHDLKILHRDLKSANVFLFKDGSAKLGDLNVSKVARKGLGYTQTGTPYYASPEVWKDQPYDNKSDIWSLGCVLYEMITLHPPFRAHNMEGLYNKVIKGEFSYIPSRYSKDLYDICKLLIQVDPKKRPSCEEILNNNIIKKRIDYFKSYTGEELNEDQALLKTINIPKNLLFLSDKLPSPNYNSFSLNRKNKELSNNTTKRNNTFKENDFIEKKNNEILELKKKKEELYKKEIEAIKEKEREMKIKQELLLNDLIKKDEKNKNNIESEKNQDVKVNIQVKNVDSNKNNNNNNILNVNKYKRLHLPEISNNVNNLKYIEPKINRLNLRVNNSLNNRNGNNLHLYRQKYKILINNSNNNSNNNLSDIYKLYGLKQHKYPKYIIDKEKINKENSSNDLKGINGLNILYNIDYNNYKYQRENNQRYNKKLNPIVKRNYINIIK